MVVPPFFDPVLAFFSEDPTLRLMQLGTTLIVLTLLFFLFYTLKDIVQRTHSFIYQFFCILIVALIPFVGFLLYILIRPSRTIKEREIEAMLLRLTIGEDHSHDRVEDDTEDEDSDEDEEGVENTDEVDDAS